MKTFRQTQQQRVLQLLKESGRSGVNSHDLTYIHGIKQGPTRVSELEDQGYKITSLPSQNKSVNYVLDYVPEDKKMRKFIGFEGNTALYIFE